VTVWALYIVTMYSFVQAFDFDSQAALTWKASMALVAISSIGVTIPTPGSVGGYHWFTSQALHLLYKVPEPAALAFATASHFLLFFLVSPILMPGMRS